MTPPSSFQTNQGISSMVEEEGGSRGGGQVMVCSRVSVTLTVITFNCSHSYDFCV